MQSSTRMQKILWIVRGPHAWWTRTWTRSTNGRWASHPLLLSGHHSTSDSNINIAYTDNTIIHKPVEINDDQLNGNTTTTQQEADKALHEHMKFVNSWRSLKRLPGMERITCRVIQWSIYPNWEPSPALSSAPTRFTIAATQVIWKTDVGKSWKGVTCPAIWRGIKWAT